MNPTQKPPITASTGELTPADILRAAATYLERHGWTQGNHYDYTDNPSTPTPPACARGAMALAAYGTAVETPWVSERPEEADFVAAAELFDDYIDRTYLMGLMDPDCADLLGAVWWNDRPERTATEVIDALRAAAQEWDDTHGGAQ
jgi:hypothetical protein